MRSSTRLVVVLVSLALVACSSNSKTSDGGTSGGGNGGTQVPGTGTGGGTASGGAIGSGGQIMSADAGSESGTADVPGIGKDGPGGSDGGRDSASDGPANDGGANDAAMDGGGVTLGPRCTSCTPRCWDSTLVREAPQETCTDPSPLAGIASHVDLVLTMPDSTKRYLVDSPFDSGSQFDWTWSFDSAKGRTFSQGLHCGKVEMSRVPTGDDTASPTSQARLTVTIDGTAYSSANGTASVSLHMKEPLGATINDPATGPLFDIEASGTLAATTGASIGLQGRMRNMHAGVGEMGLARREGSIAGQGSLAPGAAISGGTLVLASVLVNSSPAALLLDSALGADKTIPLPEVMGLVAFADGTLLAGGVDSVHIAAYDASGTQKWTTPPIVRTSLTRAGLLARKDGSACFSAAGPTSASTTYPSLLVCTDDAGVPQWQSCYLSRGFARRSHRAVRRNLGGRGWALARSSRRSTGWQAAFRVAACTTDPTNRDPPYYKAVGVARNADGGGVVQVGDDVIAFSADGELRWRSLVPRGNGEALVAADGTIYAMTGSPATVVAMDDQGRVLWTRLVGHDGQLVGLAADGSLYVFSSGWSASNALSAIRGDGSIKWSVQTEAPSWILSPDGDLYGWTANSVDRVGGGSPMADSPWPAPRGSGRRAGTR